MFKDAYDSYGIKAYMVIKHGDKMVVVLSSLMGESAVEYAPECGLIFRDAGEADAETVEKIE